MSLVEERGCEEDNDLRLSSPSAELVRNLYKMGPKCARSRSTTEQVRTAIPLSPRSIRCLLERIRGVFLRKLQLAVTFVK